MWRNYLTVGVRALAKNRTYAFINIFGLAIGLAACLMLLLYVRYETQLRRLAARMRRTSTSSRATSATRDRRGEPAPDVALCRRRSALKKDFPQIERQVYVAVGLAGGHPRRRGAADRGRRLVDGNLFDVLQFPFVQGDPRTALDDVGSLVLSETEARRCFGDDNPVGRTLTADQRAASAPITGSPA